MGVTRVGHDLVTKPPPPTYTLTCSRKAFQTTSHTHTKCIALSQFSWKNSSLLSKQSRYYLSKSLILAVLGLRGCAAFFSSCVVRASHCGASLVAEHRL